MSASSPPSSAEVAARAASATDADADREGSVCCACRVCRRLVVYSKWRDATVVRPRWIGRVNTFVNTCDLARPTKLP